MSNYICKYETDTGEITLTPETIRNTISNNPSVTDREVNLFMALCKAQKLNPFIKEAHLIKYGSNPATMVVGKDVYTKRAQKNQRFKGYRAGITVITPSGQLDRREGSMVVSGDTLVGGWCSVIIDGYEAPMFDEVSFDEYAGRKKDGSLNKTWSDKPGTMIRKVAIVHALREAFPDDFTGLYDSCEMGIEEPDDEPIEVPAEAVEVADSQLSSLEVEPIYDGIYNDCELDEQLLTYCEEF